jgi:hypothetical protein
MAAHPWMRGEGGNTDPDKKVPELTGDSGKARQPLRGAAQDG